MITDGDIVLAESGAILEYIMARYGGGRLAVAADQANFPDYLFWFHFANGTMMPSEMGSMISTLLGLKEGNPVIAMLKVRSARAFVKAYLKRIGARAAYQRASRTVIRECLRC